MQPRPPFCALLCALCSLALGACARPEFRPARFDLAAIARTDDLDARLGPVREADGLREQEIRFSSTEWQGDGRARRLLIHGFLVAPVAASPSGRRPAVLITHGLGAQAEVESARQVARNLDVVALAISGPGVGQSEGRAVSFANPKALFDTLPDARGSWLYAYTHAALRAITFLQARPEVDPDGVVITGASMGGVVSLLAAGTDPRVRGALPVNASGGLAAAAREGSWLAALIHAADKRTLESLDVQAFITAFDPLGFVDNAHAAIYLLAGAQDEFFPIDQVVRTFHAIRAPAKSLALVADFDHQWYFGQGCPAACMPGGPGAADPTCASRACPAACPAGAKWPYCGRAGSYNRSDDFHARWALLLRALVAQRAARPSRPFGPPPGLPSVQQAEGALLVDVPGPPPKVVRLALSDNGGYTYSQVQLARGPDGRYRWPLASGAGPRLFFAEAEAADGSVATSAPELPPDFRPAIRPFAPLEP